MPSINLPRAAIVRWSGMTSLVAAALIAGCSNDVSDGFAGPATVIKVTGQTDISAQVATDAGPYIFTVTDSAGNGVQGVVVNFTITGPATLATTTATTDKGGNVLTSVHFGQVVGIVAITATATGIATPAVVHTSSYAGPPVKLAVGGGQGQIGVHGTVLPDPVSVIVTDQYNNPVSQILVSLSATAGTLGATSGRTTADGTVVTTYTLPAAPGVQTITASALFNGTTNTVTITATGT